MAAQFEVYKNKKGEFRWRLRAKNKQIVASGQAYKTKSGCKKGIEAVKKAAAEAAVVDE